MEVTLINGNAYDYVNIIINILGVPVKGVYEINYTEVQEKTNNYGTGERPHSRGRAAIEPDGSLGIDMEDVEALRDVAPDGSLLQLPAFDIVVVFTPFGKVTTHVLLDVEFVDDGVETTQGDSKIGRTFGLVISKVKFR